MLRSIKQLIKKLDVCVINIYTYLCDEKEVVTSFSLITSFITRNSVIYSIKEYMQIINIMDQDKILYIIAILHNKLKNNTGSYILSTCTVTISLLS